MSHLRTPAESWEEPESDSHRLHKRGATTSQTAVVSWLHQSTKGPALPHDLESVPPPRAPRVALMAALLLGAALVLAACGSTSSTAATSDSTTTAASTGSPTGTTPGTTPGGAGAFQAYRSCLEQHGVTTTTRAAGSGAGGGPRGTLPDDPATQAAMTACQSLRPAGGTGAGGGGARGQAQQAYLSCLTDHGVTVDTTPGTRPTIDQTDPTVVAANKICGPLRPQGNGAGRGTSTTTATP